MRVALYVRRSTNEHLQADSLNAQEEILTAYAVERRMEIVDTYPDSASGRSTRGRTGFTRLVADVQRGTKFEAILVRDVSRWGRFANIDESAYWEFFFLAHGVRVLYVQETFRDDDTPYASLMKSLKRVLAAEFSRDKSRMVQFGKYRAVKAGFWPGGDPPYALVRVVVDADGRPLHQLEHGQRKAVNSYHTKLALGKRAEVATVRRVFRLYLKDGLSPAAIAQALTKAGTPTPRGATRWRALAVVMMLTNGAYAGFSECFFGASQNFPSDHRVLVENAWPAIIDRASWDAVQRSVARKRWLRSPDGLASQLRDLFEKWGVVTTARALGESGKPTVDTYRKYFTHGDNEAILHAYRDEIGALWETICTALESRGASVAREGNMVVVDGALRVGYKVAFPRSHHLGRIHWRFDFDAGDRQDVTIGIAMGPTGDPAFYFRFVNFLFHKKTQSIMRHMYSNGTKSTARTLDTIIASLRRDAVRYSSDARSAFLAAVAGLDLVNCQAVARALGWPEPKGYSLYRKLKAEGVRLPPLLRQNGRRVTIVCDDCGAARTMPVGLSLQRKSSLCAPCTRKRGVVAILCPDCGETRLLLRGPLEKLQKIGPRRCRKCNFAVIRKRKT